MIIRTIAGDISPANLGRTNYHEHAFQISPLLKGDELDNLEKSAKEFARLAKSGFDSYVDATPIGLGRRVDKIEENIRISMIPACHCIGGRGDGRANQCGLSHLHQVGHLLRIREFLNPGVDQIVLNEPVKRICGIVNYSGQLLNVAMLSILVITFELISA